MDLDNRSYINVTTNKILGKIFTENQYRDWVCGIIIDDVVRDVEECADTEFNDSDISLAVQRTLMKALNIEI